MKRAVHTPQTWLDERTPSVPPSSYDFGGLGYDFYHTTPHHVFPREEGIYVYNDMNDFQGLLRLADPTIIASPREEYYPEE